MADDAIPAASILLLRDAPAFEVLMIKRNKNIGFAGGALVFPGGRVDESDHDPAWENHSVGLSAAPASLRAALVASIREAFEETGLLLARSVGGDVYVGDDVTATLDGERGAVEKNASLFLDLMAREKLTLACDALSFFAHWVPPEGLHNRRYDTRFFAARAPVGQRAREDGNEATDAIWIEPKAALSARASGEYKMLFPTARNLELLAVSKDAEAVAAFASERTIERIQPSVIERDGEHFLTIPEGLGYPITEESLESAVRI